MEEAGGSRQSQEELLLDCVQVTPDHLRTNGNILTRFSCSGIAELVDNAVDSQAKNVYIKTGYKDRIVSGTMQRAHYISVADDGQGMDREEALKTIGKSLKRRDEDMIGLKSDSIRVGETMLLCTLKDKEYTILMVSLPYLETVAGNKCLVPCISYKVTGDGRKVPRRTNEKHKLALSIILKWSPFADETKLLDFLELNLPEKERKSGTVVVLSVLRSLENNEQWTPFEMVDRRRGEDGAETVDALSEFLKNLYLEPKVIIFIHDRQVRLLDPLRSYASPRWKLLSVKGMESFLEREKENVKKDLKKLKNKARPIEERLQTLKSELSKVNAAARAFKELRLKQRKEQVALKVFEKPIELLNQRLSSIDKGKEKPGADIRVYFGMDVERRAEPRAIFYSSGRRVLVHTLTAKGTQAFKMMGVVCTINIPSRLLPTKKHRESFVFQSDFDAIAKEIEKHAKTYSEYIDQHKPIFWKDLGYDEPEFNQFVIREQRNEEVKKKIFELMGSGRRQCRRCREFRPVDWKQFNEEQKVKCKEYHCAPACKQKTASPKSAEVIKELHTKGTATSSKHLEKSSKAAQKRGAINEPEKKKKREEERKRDGAVDNNKLRPFKIPKMVKTEIKTEVDEGERRRRAGNTIRPSLPAALQEDTA